MVDTKIYIRGNCGSFEEGIDAERFTLTLSNYHSPHLESKYSPHENMVDTYVGGYYEYFNSANLYDDKQRCNDNCSIPCTYQVLDSFIKSQIKQSRKYYWEIMLELFQHDDNPISRYGNGGNTQVDFCIEYFNGKYGIDETGATALCNDLATFGLYGIGTEGAGETDRIDQNDARSTNWPDNMTNWTFALNVAGYCYPWLGDGEQAGMNLYTGISAEGHNHGACYDPDWAGIDQPIILGSGVNASNPFIQKIITL